MDKEKLIHILILLVWIALFIISLKLEYALFFVALSCGIFVFWNSEFLEDIKYRIRAKKDLNKYRKLANLGDAYAQYEMGWRYHIGIDVIQDHELALDWYLKAAKQGQVDAQYELGLCSEQNTKMNHNQTDKEAACWLQKAANQGNASAQYELGRYYSQGIGVTENEETSFEYYMKAAVQGLSKAERIVGYYYLEGIGIPKDLSKAIEWLEKAAEYEDEGANRFLYRIKSGEYLKEFGFNPLSPDGKQAFKSGMSYYIENDFKIAKVFFDESIKYGYIPKTLYFNRGFCLHKMGYNLSAIVDFDKEILLYPDDCNNYYMRSFPKQELNDFDGARKDLQEAIILSKVDSELNENYILGAKENGDWESHTLLYSFRLENLKTSEEIYKIRMKNNNE